MKYPLYDERMEHDACGVGAVIEPSGAPSHRTVNDALTLVERLAHRAGCDAEGTTGDGVGILTQIPHALFAAWARQAGLALGDAREYGAAMLFLPQTQEAANRAMQSFERVCAEEGLTFLGWRDVPTRPELLGAGALRTMPRIAQGFVKRPQDTESGAAFDRRLYLARRRFEKVDPASYVCSFSSRIIVYKGMMLVHQLRTFYVDLQSEDYASALAMVHSRFSTNTDPSWQKAHPHRMLLHNGEINTIRGNADRMLAREETMRSPLLNERLADAYPVVDPNGSDLAMLDNALEFLAMNGMPLPLCGMTLIPEAWQGKDAPWSAMYRYYATLMEPWDGPAALLYTDGDTVCAQLDRNGLRPLRCELTDDDRLILSSEAGVLWEETRAIRRWRLSGGGILCADLRTGEWAENDALKAIIAARQPYERWVRESILHMDELPPAAPSALLAVGWQRLAKAHGYTYEDVHDVLLPMAEKGVEPIGSMGADEPPAALSNAHPPLYSYFKQRFAQVTNPPIDALREKCVTDTTVYLGDSGNLLSADSAQCRALQLDTPILTVEELNRIRKGCSSSFTVKELSICYPVMGSMKAALDALLVACDQAGDEGASILVLSDRATDECHIALPSLLAVSALEQHLIYAKRRMSVSVVIESADVRDAHQAALLIAFGARAVAPYLAHACIAALCEQGQLDMPAPQAIANYNRALTDGVVHIASKMGVSTLQSYQSAQLFEAVGLDADFVNRHFTNTPHRLSGAGLARIEAETGWHHAQAFRSPDGTLDSVGFHRLRTGKRAEEHLYSPEVIHTLQRAVWENDAALFEKYAALVRDDGPRTIRSLLDFAFDRCTPVPPMRFMATARHSCASRDSEP